MSNNTPKELNHTPEPWSIDWHFIVAPDPKGIYPDIYIADIVTGYDDEEPDRIASPNEQEANGHRIVAAINACRSIPTEALEAGAIHQMLETLEKLMCRWNDYLFLAEQAGEKAEYIEQAKAYGQMARSCITTVKAKTVR